MLSKGDTIYALRSIASFTSNLKGGKSDIRHHSYTLLHTFLKTQVTFDHIWNLILCIGLHDMSGQAVFLFRCQLTKMTEFGEGNKGLKPASYERIVFKNASEYHYLKIHLEFQEADISLNAVEFKQLIISALKRLHGEVGAALPVDLLTYEEKTLSAILRVPTIGLVKLWSALTLFGSYQNRKCSFRVIQTSPFLLALAGNSREMVLD
ncbi:ribonuclease P protein subunit p14 [Elgaria multicarinata webbii]|uniref:ribonuclease P protein subunit p14 n=1 Tax=Elgaria multicarinata webbii TaxID=159646 RepID=UPI002FCCF753